MKIQIYQINSKRDHGRTKFLGLSKLKAPVDSSSYDEVFRGDVDCGNLEDVFLKFDTNRHPLHRGHSLSVSDVVVTENGAYFCDTIGFKKITFDKSKAYKPDNLLQISNLKPLLSLHECRENRVLSEMVSCIDSLHEAAHRYKMPYTCPPPF